MPLSMGMRTSKNLHAARWIDANFGRFPQTYPATEGADRLRGRNSPSFDVGRITDAAQFAVARRFAFTLVEPLHIGQFERFLERGIIVARVVSHDDRSLMRKRFDEVAPAQIGRVNPHLA